MSNACSTTIASAWRVFLLTSVGYLLIATSVVAEPIPSKLVCEYSSNPMAVDTLQPRFGWSFERGKHRGERQTAYQVLVASDEESLKKGPPILGQRQSRKRRQHSSRLCGKAARLRYHVSLESQGVGRRRQPRCV